MKGREAVRSARRRESEAREEAESLRAELRRQKDEHKSEVDDLRSTLIHLQQDVTRAAREMADQEISRAQKRHRAEIERLKSDHYDRCVAAFRILEERATKLDHSAWADLNEALGLQIGEMNKILGGGNRNARRVSNNEARLVHQLKFEGKLPS